MEKNLLLIYLQPGAHKDEIIGQYGDPPRLKIKISAPPIDGAANKALINFLAKTLKLSKSNIEIIRGHTSKNKDLLIDASSEQLQILLKGHAPK